MIPALELAPLDLIAVALGVLVLAGVLLANRKLDQVGAALARQADPQAKEIDALPRAPHED